MDNGHQYRNEDGRLPRFGCLWIAPEENEGVNERKNKVDTSTAITEKRSVANDSIKMRQGKVKGNVQKEAW